MLLAQYHIVSRIKNSNWNPGVFPPCPCSQLPFPELPVLELKGQVLDPGVGRTGELAA